MKSTQTQTSREFGAILLIAGSCIGSAMLGLPVLSAPSGFIPSIFWFILSWLFMCSSGLLLLEVNLWFKEDVSLISMAKKTLGNFGQSLCWILFLFLFYCLLIAMVSASGSLTSQVFDQLAEVSLPHWVGSVAFTALFGFLVIIGTRAVDEFNRLLMLGLAISYLLMLMMGGPQIKLENLQYSEWKFSLLAVPAMVISFGYHNLIPSVTRYLKHEKHRLKHVVILGSFLPLIIYVLWQALILGIVPIENLTSVLEQGETATLALKNAAGNDWVVILAQHFALFAVVTTFLGITLSFVDFLADGFNLSNTLKNRTVLCLLTLAPPFIISFTYSGLFLKALSYAGAFGAVILFGLLPVAMVWVGRNSQKNPENRLLPGGKISLSLVAAFAILVIVMQLIEELAILRS